ncbi:FAS1 domain-containing protein AFUA_8G05360 OS=Neosartorya fumigata (strain ATCC MYA-4609 / Af293 / CBS 101355 / FGSC A1100) GN=AFUA_8G05360 PE=3 SV=1 [Rhizoctonia solani AG-1 IB]|uniref:FAS1 domain-containing protein AFUA_8G05360 n=1 Tax=Thanatephorus cucumeris (strain AG1-IB / isolate 7/3/14) TaxID=1108050 RepID=M5C3L9_THACB|nr:FAS1 domain-containing protein AFUA_8G05360 [Rhizoctonia solani AG-1 IB]CEL54364.1 FAS1 domain-containing protein AFUA_8G05360 OS=Neosartorya fumigata (strain ATCC MYA-4609 / Af293 / CBS 101355 / FGSC A1100) GN=AFUA_8G05360 PE=3 SV=1 [Rhizoctonia solani AG-1 IB]
MSDTNIPSLTNPNGPTLADVLTIQQSSSIFYDYLREIPDIVDRLTDTSGNMMSTVFVPRNKAVITLPRKPHLGPVGDEVEIMTGRQYDERSRKNIARWIGAHVIPSHPIELVGSHSTMHPGKSIRFECQDGEERTWEHCTLESGVKIVQRVEASNGVLYIIDGTIKP